MEIQKPIFPFEIILEIGKNLEGSDLVKFSMINKEIYELMEKQRREEFRKYFEECVKRHNKRCYTFYDGIDPYCFYKIVEDDNIQICCNCRMFIDPYDFIFPKNICMNCLKGEYDI